MPKIKNKRAQGFTLIELLITLGITVILGSIGTANYFNYQSSVATEAAAAELTGTLRDARQRAISQDNSSAWGVYINSVAGSNDYYELFYGNSYAAGTVVSRTTLSTGVQFSVPAQGQTLEINFAKSTGLPSSESTITIASVRDSSIAETTTFNTTTGIINTVSGVASAPTVSSITPNYGSNTGSVNITNLAGTNFQQGASVKLTKTSQTDISCTSVSFVSSIKLTASCNLTSAAAGLWNVGVVNSDNQSGTLSNGFTINGAPSAPTIGTASAGNAQVTVAFTAPTSDGGSAITGYTATSNPGGFTAASSTSPITVTGLTNGTAYTLTVTATNAIGTGPASAASNSVTPIDSTRVFVTSTTYNGNLGGLSGGDAICQARAVAGGLGGSWKAWLSDAATSVVNRFIQANNSYVNLNGNVIASNWPDLIDGALSAAVGYNENKVAVVTDTRAWTGTQSNGTIWANNHCSSWTSSSSGGTGGVGVTTSASANWTWNQSQSCDVSWTLYCFEQPGSTVPGAPIIGTATRGNTQATVAFTAPGNGGSAITGYTAISSPAGGTDSNAGTTGLSHIVTGLTNGTAYTFTVTATNAIGTSPASATSNSVTPATIPGAPTIGTATPGNTQATVAFTPPASDGGSAITGYTATSNPGGLTGTGSASPIIVTGLTNLTPYTFTVTATNAIGTGSASAASNSVTPATPPGAPTIGTATAGNAQATVTFTAPASDGGNAISTYTATSAPGGLTGTCAGPSACTITVTGLTTGTAYTFTVTATNAIGTGSASAASNSIIAGPLYAAGGTITYTDSSYLNPRSSPPYVGGYTVHTFTGNGTFTPDTNGTVEYLIFAGGGGGGNNGGGGGGGGGYLTGATAVTPQPYTITVGNGGAAGYYPSVPATVGYNSSALGFTASGGGRGGNCSVGGDGGSGGGGSTCSGTYRAGGLGTAGPPRQGYDGRGWNSDADGGAGGGGAGGVGVGVQETPGTGVTVFGVCRGGGGGGGVGQSGTECGIATCGGGNGSCNGAGGAGTANTGGGGGGGANWQTGYADGGAGGSGIVIIRYPTLFSAGYNYQGGKVAYILQSGDPGYDANITHGLIAATSNLGTQIRWYNGSFISTGATATALGTGLANTNTIMSVQGTVYDSYAAGLARAYAGGGYSDWYLPSKNELIKLYLNKTAIGGFESNNIYWSSSEFNSNGAWIYNFSTGYPLDGDYGGKETLHNVRAIRSF